MEKKLQNTWENLIIDLSKNWILKHDEFHVVNGLASKFIAVTPEVDVDVNIEYVVHDLLGFTRTEFLAICSFNDLDFVSEKMKTIGNNIGINDIEDEDNSYVSCILLKKGKVYILPKAEFINFMPGTVKILYEVSLPDFPEHTKVRQHSISYLMFGDTESYIKPIHVPGKSFNSAEELASFYGYPGF